MSFENRSQWKKDFYWSNKWRNMSRAYKKKVGGLCEQCQRKGLVVPGDIVHHKIHLNAHNVHDHSISLNMDNLELLCRKCHGEQHSNYKEKRKNRFKIDNQSGKVEFEPPHR